MQSNPRSLGGHRRAVAPRFLSPHDLTLGGGHRRRAAPRPWCGWTGTGYPVAHSRALGIICVLMSTSGGSASGTASGATSMASAGPSSAASSCSDTGTSGPRSGEVIHPPPSTRSQEAPPPQVRARRRRQVGCHQPAATPATHAGISCRQNTLPCTPIATSHQCHNEQ